MIRLGSLAPLLWLAACGSPPVHDLILATIPPAHGAVTSGRPLRVGQVSIPPDLDRNEVVTKASPTALHVYRQDVWGAPLGGMIQRTLSADLAARLGENRVLAVDDPTSPSGTRTLTLSIRQFIADPNGQVVLDADWTLQGTGADASPHHATVTTRASAMSADAVAQAMSQALARLSDRIARDL
ncbi:MAG TPA: PqiC family protein [Rhodopila sp.]|jgi:hypothetical protein|nr:PqiC family protein [Rhodopila sp.]